MAKKKKEENVVDNPFGNRFLLSVAVAKRARQLKEGGHPKVNAADNYQEIPVVVALDEIKKGKIKVVMRKERDLDEELIEEISDFLDEDGLDDTDSDQDAKPKKEPKSKAKSASN